EKNPLLERAADDDGPPKAESSQGDQSEAEGAREAAQEPQASDWSGEEFETSRDSMEQGLGTGLENVFPDADSGSNPAPAASEPQAGYSEWSGTGSGSGQDNSYNLEAFVSAEVTLADHLAEQMNMAISDPIQRMIGQYLIDMVDEAGYIAGEV